MVEIDKKRFIRDGIAPSPPHAASTSGVTPVRRTSEPHTTWTRGHMWFAILCAISGIVFWGPLRALVRLAAGSDYYSHTVFIPALAAFLVFRERKKIFSSSRTSLRLSIPLLLIVGCLFILQNFALLPVGSEVELSLAILSVVLFWMGGFALCYGERAFQAALFPLLFLVLTVPLPLTAMDDFIHVTRVGSTAVASAIFAVSGLPILRHGFLFVLPGLTIEVAKECSGIHSTIALFILSLVAGCLFIKFSWKRALLLLFVFPVVSLTNGFRIVTLTLLAEYVDRNILNSSLHRNGGVLFFLLACALMGGVLQLISGKHERGHNHPEVAARQTQPSVMKQA